jgi:hypothetical protein
MKKTTIIILVIVVIALLGAGVFLFLQNKPAIPVVVGNTGTLPGPSEGNTTTPGNNSSGTILLLGDATVSSADISSAMPSDAPKGATIAFQTASGTIALKNFYSVAQGYWAPLNALLLANSPSYTMWYYRDNSEFSIVIPLGGTASSSDAAATVLAADLGVNEQELCALPVAAVFMIDRGMDSEQYPLDFCPPSTLVQ